MLRTHTSPVQIRSMVEEGAPIRIIAPGRVYRCDSDQTHTPMFHQVEGLVIGRDISFANLKAVLHQFVESYFERKAKLRFRASYFPLLPNDVRVLRELLGLTRGGVVGASVFSFLCCLFF